MRQDQSPSDARREDPDPALAPRAADPAAWRRFGRDMAVAALAIGAAAVAFVMAMDPYGLRAAPGRPGGPIMDRNQRFMYPQIARGGPFDAAVFGTSTARLLDPEDLDRAFGARFANLAINAATPDEQGRLAALFLAGRPVRAALFGLDATWCAGAPPRRTAHPFPDWLYEPEAPGAVLKQVNLQGLAVAGRVALHALHLAPERLRPDGYGVFTPPEAAYDLARARLHIRAGTRSDPEAVEPASGPDRPEAGMPALDRLDALLAALPAPARRIVAFMPVHVAAQGASGTEQGRREAACKARVAEIGRRRGALVVDFRIPSPVTTEDSNYWDALHYRLPIASRIVAGLKAAAETGADDSQGFYRVLARP
ncbi:hypothetical protein [Methylobacterium symbioticum]|uniref:Uncharacterized protein n=1 Tax=Methylobacterium symbioticum TaxID=2584084 RepID=A0A509EGM0_9HYPH|nr:hypothetical protein [Methylobacterium symbioticum]VUD73212.1 hypothetical protein MET9862_03826 [Methylobacterium symbioticum]